VHLLSVMRRGLAVPQRLRVAGFGDLPFSEECVPPLTTVQPRATQIGLRLAQELMERAEQPGDETEPRIIDVGFELVVRASTQSVEPVQDA